MEIENEMDHESEDDFALDDMDQENEMDEINLLETASSDTIEKQKGTTTSNRRRAKCWKNFKMVEVKDDGRYSIDCNHCKRNFCLDLRPSGTNTLNRHMKTCHMTPGSTPRSGIRKLDMMVFREMIALAIIEHDLPYSFVEYQRIREAFSYANPDIEFWSRNTSSADVLKIYEKEKKKLREVLSNIPDGLTILSEALEKIRQSVKFVKGSESRENTFQNCVETVGVQSKAGLVLDCLTRWNSTHLMLSRPIKFKDAFRSLAEVEKTYKTCPSDIEWKRGELICDLLTPFSEMTNLISGSSYPTSNLYFMQVWKIETWLRTNEDSNDYTIFDMVTSMRMKFDKYWEEYSDILAIAAVFDPRLKFAFLEYCFTTLDSSTASSKLAHVRNKMDNLFEAYKSKTSDTYITVRQVETIREDVPSGYDGFYSYVSQKASGGIKSPLDTYLEEPVLDMIAFKSIDILAYWKDNSSHFKDLASMACDVLSIPITTVASESSFSIGSRVLNKYRSCLLLTNVQALICAKNWLRGFQEVGEEFKFIEEKEKRTEL